MLDINHYQTQGYIAIPQLLNDDEVEQARQALSQAMLNLVRDARAGKIDYKPANGAYSARATMTKR